MPRFKIIKKSVILFELNNMTIWCKHVHRLELQKFFNSCAAYLPVRLDKETKFPYFLFLTWGGGPRVVVSTAAFHQSSGFGSRSRRFGRNKKCFFPIHVWNSVLWGASVTEKWRARPQTARDRISNSVSGGQCHLNHFTILRRFSLPSLAYMCTKVA